jgi:hypothetical protein
VEWYEWVFQGIGVLVLGSVGTWLYRRFRRRPADPTERARSLVKGNVGDDSRIRRARMRNADHLVEGDVGNRSYIDDIDFK